MPQFSQDLVIMNPPFTRAGSDWEGASRSSDYIKQFRGLDNDLKTQRKMSALEKKYGVDTCAHGYAGIASWFVALADRMVKRNGAIALVLPLTVLQGSSWQKVRKLLAENYEDVIVITIAASQSQDQSFSADTGMAETLIVARQSSNGRASRGLFVNLDQRPNNEMESLEIAKAISTLASDPNVRKFESGPIGGEQLVVGDAQLGEVINAPLSSDLPWSSAGVADFSVVQTAHQLTRGQLWLPQMRKQDRSPIAISTIQQISRVGLHHMNIASQSPQAAFDRINTRRGVPTYPLLWNHDAKKETKLIVQPDSEGRIKPNMHTRAAEIWNTRSHAHYSADFRFNSQPLGVAFTEERTIGGTAWPNLQFDSKELEIAHTLWGNSTLGLLLYWWHSSRQQAGRGRMPVTAIRTMPTFDVTSLSDAQLQTAESIFKDMRHHDFLPANEAYRDMSRQELDRRVLLDLLGLPDTLLEPLDVLRLKWCSEPSVHGGKGTGP